MVSNAVDFGDLLGCYMKWIFAVLGPMTCLLSGLVQYGKRASPVEEG
jgi:hypothetical protein